MSAQGPTNAQRAMEYYKHAAEYIDAYGKLSKADADAPSVLAKDLMQASVKQLILGHALELVMKGWLVLYEGNPVHLTSSERRALMQAGQPVPITLKNYGHDLEKLAADVVRYYPGLEPYVEKTMPVVDASGAPVPDEQGQQRKQSLLEHLNSSYWAGGARQYEYPEASEVAERQHIAFLSPLDQFAAFVATFRHELLQAILTQTGGTVPPAYQKSAAPSRP